MSIRTFYGRLNDVTATADETNTSLCCPGLFDGSMSEADAEELAVVLKALADPVRLRLMNLIAQADEVCACDLPGALDRSQPTVSHHLKVLVEAGLLDRQQRGKWAWFRVRRDQLDAVGEILRLDAHSVPSD